MIDPVATKKHDRFACQSSSPHLVTIGLELNFACPRAAF